MTMLIQHCWRRQISYSSRKSWRAWDTFAGWPSSSRTCLSNLCIIIHSKHCIVCKITSTLFNVMIFRNLFNVGSLWSPDKKSVSVAFTWDLSKNKINFAPGKGSKSTNLSRLSVENTSSRSSGAFWKRGFVSAFCTTYRLSKKHQIKLKPTDCLDVLFLFILNFILYCHVSLELFFI